MNKSKPLSKDSRIAFVAPARKITREEITPAIEWLDNQGFVPVFDDRLFAESNQFAGDDNFRASVFQEYIDSRDIDAIWLVRGGYGGLRIVDKLDFRPLERHPKWIVGYSDSTVFLNTLQRIGFESIHATMPLSVPENTDLSLDSLLCVLKGKTLHYEFYSSFDGQCHVQAPIVGGNLSVLYSLLGSGSFPDTEGNILFIEDLDEYLYHIDRMMMALKRAGKLNNLAALLVGGMTQMHDNTVPFGKTAEEIVADCVKEFGYPVCFGFPAGHIADNRAFVVGRPATLDIADNHVVFVQE